MENERLIQLIRNAKKNKQKTLNLRDQAITELPPEIGDNDTLEVLFLDGNKLTRLPKEIGNLKNLWDLSISNNLLIDLPTSIGNLTRLKRLRLQDNKLQFLPAELGNLHSLQILWMARNKLTGLPKEIGNLSQLEELFILDNKLIELPSELGKIKKLTSLALQGNPLPTLPPEIRQQGTRAILAYLREQGIDKQRQWKSKLIIVGQGGVGKTALLQSLMRERFNEQSSTTHGINIRELKLPHPKIQATYMELNAWDFGGQEIYHATHQFFLTNRSLFLLVWNARHGYEQGKLYYWLDTIRAKAPESPIVIVGTHTDERDADLPITEICLAYPQVVGHIAVSNKSQTGIDTLQELITETAAKLPLMGEQWPGAWLNASNALRKKKEKYINLKEFETFMNSYGVRESNQRILAQWLHELGDILFFQDDEEINDLVILKPQWVTEYISMVLESDEVIKNLGILTKTHRDALWKDLSAEMRDHFLRLMEKFDLSYRTLENREISLVVERLSLDAPEFKNLWDSPLERESCNEITMKYQLNTLQPGIPTWFIARSHRFTTYTHWRNGAVFADDRHKPNHLSLVQALPHERSVTIRVRGPNPQNFSALLIDGLELTLARFPGLSIDRLIPCPGHNGKPCNHYFRYEQLLKRVELKKFFVECPEALEEVDARQLLFGIGINTLDAVYLELKKTQEESARQHKELLALLQREFSKAYKREQSFVETYVPNVFVFRPEETRSWKKILFGEKIKLQLYCQEPGCWHPLTKDKKFVGCYTINSPQKWIKELTPYLRNLILLLKFVSPFIGPWVDIANKAYSEQVKGDIDFMNELVKAMPELDELGGSQIANMVNEAPNPERASGVALRILRQLLQEVDPEEHWGGLKRVLTPEGHYLWLCDYHAEKYLV